MSSTPPSPHANSFVTGPVVIHDNPQSPTSAVLFPISYDICPLRYLRCGFRSKSPIESRRKGGGMSYLTLRERSKGGERESARALLGSRICLRNSQHQLLRVLGSRGLWCWKPCAPTIVMTGLDLECSLQGRNFQPRGVSSMVTLLVACVLLLRRRLLVAAIPAHGRRHLPSLMRVWVVRVVLLCRRLLVAAEARTHLEPGSLMTISVDDDSCPPCKGLF